MTSQSEADEKTKGVVLHDEVANDLSRFGNGQDHEETALMAIKKHPWVLTWCLFAIWMLVSTSFDNQVGGTVISIPQFRKDFGFKYGNDYVLPANWQSAHSGGPVATSVIGTLGAGYIADRIGRKYTYVLALIILAGGIGAQVASRTNPIFFLGKMINGFACGAMITTSMTYIAEIAPLAIRGPMIAAAAVSFTVGSCMVQLILNEYGTLENRWAYQGIFVAQYGVAAIGAIFLPFMPESPFYLISHNKLERAQRSLRKLGYNQEEAEQRMAVIQVSLDKISAETEGVTYLECFRRSNLRRTIVSVAPLSIQALCGVFFMSVYATYYYQLAGMSNADSFKLAIGNQCISMAGNISSWFIIDRVGRRRLSVWGMVIVTVILFITGALAVVGTAPAITGTVAFIQLYCYFYNVSIGATAYTALTEIATGRLRAKTASIGLALQNSLFTMWAFVIPYLFNPDQANLGAKVAFIFGGLSVICTTYLFFYHPEVAGRSYEELDEMFMKGVPAWKFEEYKTESRAQAVEHKE